MRSRINWLNCLRSISIDFVLATGVYPEGTICLHVAKRHQRLRTHRAWDTLQGLAHRIICRLPGKVCVVQIRSALAWEGPGDPGVLIVEIPDRDPDAPIHLDAAGDGIIVVLGLERERGGIGRIGLDKSNVQLGDCDLQSQGNVALFSRDLLFQTRGSAHFEVRLQTHAVDPDPSRLHLFDQAIRGLRLVSGVFNAIVVVEELDVLAGGLHRLLRELIGEEEVFWTNRVILQDVSQPIYIPTALTSNTPRCLKQSFHLRPEPH